VRVFKGRCVEPVGGHAAVQTRKGEGPEQAVINLDEDQCSRLFGLALRKRQRKGNCANDTGKGWRSRVLCSELKKSKNKGKAIATGY